MPSSRDRWLAITYAAAIFVSAFLLFQIQPLISKRILPWFGGTPAVWTTCLLFFQTVLFAGYAYAHWSNNRLGPRQQAFVHAALIVLALVLMHALPSESWEPTGAERPIPRILLILAMSIGLPYFVLSATGPLLQAWFARTFPGRIPYRLYALSNIGSLLALASYPFFFEPKFNLSGQAQLWTAGFVIYAALCVYIAWRISTAGQAAPDKSHRRQAKPDLQEPPRAYTYAFWLTLAAFASVVLIATTNHISTDIPVMPLLWIAPLALYLITFIIAFDRPTWYRRVPVALLAIGSIYAAAVTHRFIAGRSLSYEIGTIGLVFAYLADPNAPLPTFHVTTPYFVIANFTALFAICLLCHGEIVRTRPAPRYLTSFYLMISAGGALGAIFATIIAPLLFKTYFEWDAALFLACLASLGIVIWACVTRLMRAHGQRGKQLRFSRKRYTLIGATTLVLLSLTLVIMIDVSEFLGSRFTNIRWSARDFFGTFGISESDADDEQWNRYNLFHGTTDHGSQYTNKNRKREPTTYYGPKTGVGIAVDYFHKHLPPGQLRLGVVGLGAATLAAYPDAGDLITFYEIDPTIIELAESGEWFTYVRDCRARGAHCDFRLGDARLTLQRELGEKSASPLGDGRGEGSSKQAATYHLLVLDAFSGDSVPVHLLTIEAFKLYLKRLTTATNDKGKPTEVGAIAVHISNRYLNLEPVVRAAAYHFDMFSLAFYTPEDPDRGVRAAEWIILTRNAAMAAKLRSVTTPVRIHCKPVLWTDDRSSLFEILK